MTPYRRLLKRKTKKFFNVTFEIITGFQPMDEKKVRQENIKYIFTHTIYPMAEVEKEYDSCLNTLKDHDEAKLVAYQKLSN